MDGDGIYAIAALATTLKNDFVQYLDQVWPYIEHSFSNLNNLSLFKVVLFTLADIARACETDFYPKIYILDSLF